MWSMWRVVILVLCIIMFQGLSIASSKAHTKKQRVETVKKKGAKKSVISKSVSIESISAKYGEGKTFQADPDGIRLTAMSFYSTPYRFGGTSPNGLDCSAFVQKVFRANGIYLPRDSRSQARYGYKVSLSELKPGDLLFFKTYRNDISHVGIYIGDGKMIHATTRGGEVLISRINDPYYRKRFVFAKRIIEYGEKPEEDIIYIIVESLERGTD